MSRGIATRIDRVHHKRATSYDQAQERAAIRFLQCLPPDARVLVYLERDGRTAYKCKVLRPGRRYWNFEFAGYERTSYQASEPRRPAHCVETKLARLAIDYDALPDRAGLAMLFERAEELAS